MGILPDLADWRPMDVDIWSWVGETQRQLHEAGNTGLAMAIGDVPAQALEGRYAQLDVLAPAIAQQAENLGLPWLEFYARYWHLIGRIGNRAQGVVALDDARTLVEFAGREDVRDCPSAPGAVVALAIAQANTDGPGYAAERLEALAALGVEPASQAFSAVAEQYVAALVDAGRADEAVAHAEAAVAELGAAGREASWELGASGRCWPPAARRTRSPRSTPRPASSPTTRWPSSTARVCSARSCSPRWSAWTRRWRPCPTSTWSATTPASGWSGRTPCAGSRARSGSPTAGSSAASSSSGSTTSP
nr:hypothetical protein GCM10020093_104730 [Planobispora longispora]